MADNSSGSFSGGPLGSKNTGNSGAFSWAGGSSPSTFDPKAFGTKIFGDVSKAYGQGPQVNPIANYVPYGQQTLDLINKGLGQVNANADPNSILSRYASGAMLGQGNPYLNDALKQTANDVTQNENSTFNSLGLFGSDLHAKGLAEGLGNAENAARFGQYNNDYSQMLQALGQQQNNTATGLGYSNLLDQKAQELNTSNQDVWNRTHNAAYDQIAKYLALLQNGNAQQNTNQPTSIWDILGGVGSVVGKLL